MRHVPDEIFQGFCDMNYSSRRRKIRQGIDALRALPDAGAVAAFDELLTGVSYEGERWRHRFEVAPHFKDTPLSHYNNRSEYEELISSLILGAPAGSKKADRLGAKVKNFSVWHERWELDVTDGLARLTGAESIGLVNMTIPDLSVFGGLPELKYLSMEGCTLPSPVQMSLGEAARTLRLNRCAVSDLSGLDAPTLTDLTLNQNPLTSLETLPRLTNLTELNLHGCDQLQTLRGFPPSPNISRLGMGQTHALEHLDDLPSLPGVKSLSLNEARALTRIDGVERLSGLEQLLFTEVSAPIDITPIASLTELVGLGFPKCTGVTSIAALDGVENIKLIMLYQSGTPRRAVKKDLRWRCSWAHRDYIPSDMLEAAKRKTPPAPAPQGADRQSLTKVRKLLKTAEEADVRQGLEILQLVGAPEWYDNLLGGADYSSISRPGQLGRSGWRVGTKKFRGRTAPFILHQLIAQAPAESAVAAGLREQIDKLDFVDNHYGSWGAYLFDMSSLAALPNLSRVMFFHYGPFSGTEDLALPELEALGVVRGNMPLGWLANCPKLRRVRLSSWQEQFEVDWISARPELEELCLRGQQTHLTNLSFLEGHPNLKRVCIEDFAQLRDISALKTCPELEELHLQECGADFSLKPLLEAPALKRMTVDRRPPFADGELSALASKGVQIIKHKLIHDSDAWIGWRTGRGWGANAPW